MVACWPAAAAAAAGAGVSGFIVWQDVLPTMAVVPTVKLLGVITVAADLVPACHPLVLLTVFVLCMRVPAPVRVSCRAGWRSGSAPVLVLLLPGRVRSGTRSGPAASPPHPPRTPASVSVVVPQAG